MYDVLDNTLGQLRSKLQKFHESGNGYTACCPAHADKNPSLSITKEPDKILLKCHANCSFDEIVGALGMKSKNFFRPTEGRSKTVAVYDYCDANEVLLYQVVRQEPKKFYQRRPDKDNPGKFINNLKDTERVFYKLSLLLKGVNAGQSIHITEGEKDCEALLKLDYCATTIAGGTGGIYPKDFGKILRGKEVVIWGDNDEQGIKCAEKRARYLVGRSFTNNVKICYPDKGKDIYDWIENGATTTDINTFVKNTPTYEFKRVPSHTDYIEDDTEIPDKQTIITALNEGERGDGYLIEKVFKDKRVYDHTAGMWLYHAGGRWQYDRKDITVQVAYNILSKSYQSVSDENPIFDRLKDIRKLRRIKNILEWARQGNTLGVLTEDFDTNPYHLNLHNGVFELDTWRFREHKPSDLHLKQAGAAFDGKADCPKFLEFLSTVFNNDSGLIGFIQEWAGMCLSGTTDAQGFFYAYGKGANGKSTFFAVMQELLGSYFVNVPVETLLQKKQNATDEYQMTRLHGARLVVCSEIPENRRPNEGQIKDLTGGEYINARNPYGKPFTFKPTHKLALFGNHKLKITGTDNGIWRRVWLIPFTVTIPTKERRPMAEMLREFRQEINGILYWALQGWRRFKENNCRLSIPDAVNKATQDYREESDALTGFFTEKCVLNASDWCPTKELYDAYETWCKENSEEMIFTSQRRFNNAMKEREYKIDQVGERKQIFKGIGIKP